MKLSKNTVRAIVTLIVVAVGGLMILQYNLLRNTIELRDQTFKRNVFTALNDALDKIEEIDIRNRVFLSQEDSSLPSIVTIVRKGDRRTLKKKPDQSDVPMMYFSSTNLSGRIVHDKLYYVLDKTQNITVRTFNELGEHDTTLVDGLKTEGEHSVPIPLDRYAGGPFIVQMKCGTSVSTFKWEAGKHTASYVVSDTELRKKRILARVASGFSPTDRVPIANRFSNATLDSLVASGLHSQAITIPYEFGIFRNDSMEAGRTTLSEKALLESDFKVPLTKLKPFETPEILRVYFPTYKAYLFTELIPEVGSTLLLVAIIIFCFVYIVRTIVRQKEFAGRLSDFINNMTHEFKTPISTISLASEAIARPENARSQPKIKRYNGMIADENKRMKKQVEKILQMSALEEGDYELNLVPVDVHKIITKAVENISLQMTARKGTITTELNAPRSKIQADAVHLENIVHNVLDNAVKYSRNEPKIVVATSSTADQLIIRVQDNGIGIAEEHLQKVFEKYYRVPTGNVHDVKGFGLGLSYVKLVTEAHRGTIAIQSQLGKGTTVELHFPLS
jgi:two-component system phosphate regulon sensor histidine kinase PhoR